MLNDDSIWIDRFKVTLGRSEIETFNASEKKFVNLLFGFILNIKFIFIFLNMKLKGIICFVLKRKLIFFLSFPLFTYSQIDTNYALNFNFNNHQIKEVNDKVIIKPIGVTLTDDRFGNKQSAIYLHGDATSYLNLGTSNLLKPKKGTISIWVNLDRKIYTGKGYDANPIIITKNDTGYDFINAYALCYDEYAKRFGASSTKDSTKEATVASIDQPVFGKWYHMVMTYDNDYLLFYINGVLQGSATKGFETKFLHTDSVVVGNMASKKNDRWSEGIFDDIQIFHRVLNAKEVKELYEAPNPNRTSIIIKSILFYSGIALVILVVAFLLVVNHRRRLKKEEERFKLSSKLHEMETKVIKAQMNPHFMFNALNTIQQFIITNENEKAQYYLSKFSILIRKLLENTAKDSNSLADEIDILNKYLEIESLRFNNVFKYSIDVDKRINAAKTFIPHFLIQPFVENAIWHGLLTKEGNKNLTISFESINETKIACIIDDNGVGRRASEAKQSLEKKSLAINFIQQRLDLMNKMMQEGFKIIITDKLNDKGNSDGTKVTITMPIIKNM